MPRILLIDDEEDLLTVATEFLREADPNFAIVSVTSAQQAILKLEQDDFNVVVSDYQMPGMDGLKLLERLRNDNIDIPFIMFTGKGREEVAIQALNLGADYYIRKGGDPKSQYVELAHVIRSVVKHKLAERRLYRAEEDLWESEERYIELVEKLQEGVLVEDPEGIITFLNPRVNEMLGYSKDELIGEDQSIIIHPSATEKVREETNKRSHGISSSYECTLQTKDGKPIHILVSATPLFGASGSFRGVLSVFTDITERKKIEEALRKSEQEKSLILSSSKDLIVYSDRNLQIKWVNQAAGDSVGFQPEELVGRYCYDVWHQRTEPCIVCPVAKSMETGQSQQQEVTDPSGRVFDIRGNPVRDKDGNVIGAVEIAVDITKRKQAEKVLKDSEERYRLLFEDSPIALWDEDFSEVKNYLDRLFESGVKDFREYFDNNPDEVAKCVRMVKVRDVNRATMRLYNVENRESLLGTLDLFLDKKSYSVFKEELIWFWEGHTIFKGESINYKLGGGRFHVDLQLSIAPESAETWSRVIVSIIDITDLKQTEKMLQEHEKRYRDVVENISDVIVLVDFEGNIISVFEQAAQLTGFSIEELLKMNIRDFINDNKVDRPLEILRTVVEKGSITDFELTITTRREKKIPISASFTAIDDEQGSPVGILSVLRDITERKRMEEPLKRQKEELSEFAHAMAHDLGSSLTSIHGYAELLEKEYNKSFAEKIRQNARNLSELLNRSLTLADAGLIVEKTDRFDLNQLLGEVADVTIPSSITFRHDILPMVSCDRKKVSQIFKNLFENAVVHGDPTEIEVRREDSERSIEILIANDGKPILPEEEEKIFFRGYSTRKERTGLGLAIVKKLVEAHGWQITLDPSSNKTTFRILIPTN